MLVFSVGVLFLFKLFEFDLLPGTSDGSLEGANNTAFKRLGRPDNIDVSIEFKDWLFALQGAQDMAESWWFDNHNQVAREERSWHTTFRSLQIKANSNLKETRKQNGNTSRKGQHPVESIQVGFSSIYCPSIVCMCTLVS